MGCLEPDLRESAGSSQPIDCMVAMLEEWDLEHGQVIKNGAFQSPAF